MAFGAIAQGLLAGAKGAAPAIGNVMEAEQRAGEQQRAEAGRIRQHQQNLAQRQSEQESRDAYQMATLEARAAEQERTHNYRMAMEATQQARAEIDLARLKASQNNAIVDPRAEKAARAMTDFMDERPVMDMDTDPSIYIEELARWEAQFNELPKIWGYSDQDAVSEALGGTPSRHSPAESGLQRIQRLLEAGGYGIDGYSDYVRDKNARGGY